VTPMESETPLEVTALALAKLCREMTLYLEIWDLIRQEPLLPQATAR
jgi:hypothetical protein